MANDSFPRQAARTRNFRLGAPRALQVSADDQRIVFVRSDSGTDAVNRLMVIDVAGDSLTERVAADPLTLLAGSDEDLPPEEKARRERLRETTSGITAYSCDRETSRAAFALSGRLFVVELVPAADGQGSAPRELPSLTPVIDPRLSPDGSHVAYVHAGAVRVISVDGSGDRALATPDTDTVSWGLADFIAAEELDRHRGLWWSPDSHSVLAERVDDAPMDVWWISDPANPEREPHSQRYPAAGTPNADVSLHVLGLDGTDTALQWDHAALPYLSVVSWASGHDPLITVMSRDQRLAVTLTADPLTGATTVVRDDTDPAWVDVHAGLPRWAGDGRLVHVLDDDSDTRRLAVNGAPVTPEGHQFMALLDANEHGLLVTVAADPTERTVWSIPFSGESVALTTGGVASASRGTEITVVSQADLTSTTTRWEVRRGPHVLGEVSSRAASPALVPRPTFLRAGERAVATAVLFPSDHVPGSRRLPVIMAPYGGPHHSEVVAHALSFAQNQWMADQGFVVIVADGRGTPGRGPAWERAVNREFVTPVLDDQVAALNAVAAAYPDDVDTARVGIVGWSFGGWLAGLAVLARPDVFHAAVAGAPVSDWRLYDTAYTERYLGHPDEEPETYERQSLVTRAAELRRPLMLVHGLSDDNVVVAHTLKLSGALMAAGRPHTVLPLTGVTHMPTQEDVAENLLLLQVDFLRRGLANIETLENTEDIE